MEGGVRILDQKQYHSALTQPPFLYSQQTGPPEITALSSTDTFTTKKITIKKKKISLQLREAPEAIPTPAFAPLLLLLLTILILILIKYSKSSSELRTLPPCCPFP